MVLGVLLALCLQQEPSWDAWKVIGPWPANQEATPYELLDEALPPEDLLQRIRRGGDPKPRGSYSREDGERVGWQDDVEGYPVNVARATGAREHSVAYLYRAFEVEMPGRVPVEITADGAYRIWVNGNAVHESDGASAEVGSVLEMDLAANAGVNHVLVKVVGAPRSLSFGMRTSFRWQRELAEMQGAIDLAIDRGVSYLLDRQAIDGSWTGHSNYPGGITPVVLYALLKCGLAPEHPAIQRGMNAMEQVDVKKVYTAGFYLLALAAANQERFSDKAEELIEWLIKVYPKGSVFGYPGSDDLSNHVVAILGMDAASRVYDIEIEDEFWIKSLEGTLALQTAEERVVLPGGGSEYMRGFTYRKGGADASGSMTSAGMTVAIITLRNVKKLPARTRKDAEEAIQQGALWLGTNWAVNTNPPNRSWQYFHLYGLERIGSLLGRELFGEHPWYLAGARYLIDNQSGEGTWAQGGGDAPKERDTSMSLLFLKRATSLAVTSEDMVGRRSLSTAEDQDVVLRATGDTPMTIWVADSRVEGTKAEFFASRKGEQLELNLGSGEKLQGRWTIRTQLPRPGKWEVWSVLDTPGGTLTSPRLEVAVRLVASKELMESSTAASRNLLLQAEDVSWRASSIQDDGRKPALLGDGSYALGWRCNAEDVDPWVLFEVRKGIRAKTIRFTPNQNIAAQIGQNRPAKLRVILNKKDVYEIEVPKDPWEKAVLELPKKERIKQLEVHITAVHGQELGKGVIGLAEIELED